VVVVEELVALVSAVDAAEPAGDELVADGVGSGAKVICTVNEGSFVGHSPDPPPELDPLEDSALVELCSSTSLTPSTRRRRVSIWATSDCEVAQPTSVNVGAVPGGVAEATADALADVGVPPAAVPTAALAVEVVEVEVVVVVVAAGAAAGVAAVLPCTEVSETS
jgi:hypothetical protein